MWRTCGRLVATAFEKVVLTFWSLALEHWRWRSFYRSPSFTTLGSYSMGYVKLYV
jgi:hypothetical protein